MDQQPSAQPATVDEADLRARLATLTLEQKVRLMTGADFWTLHPAPEAGLGRIVLSDGPAGVRGQTWDERDTSANLPCPTALAATWDPELVRRLGGLLAAEARRKGVHVVLAPTVNLHRTPYGGRHFEAFSEDPLLTERIGVAYVQGLQANGVGACVKHFVANDSETERMSLDARVDERTLREVYLAPFEGIVREGHVWSVMAAYNQVNGTPATESPLLREVLQDEWGFDGVTVSDWMATRSTVASAVGGLDLAMPGPTSPWGEALVAAVRAGEVDGARIDDHALRILRLAARVGALDGAPTPTVTVMSDDEVVAELRAAAAAGMVLVRNDGILPLAPASVSSIAVIGPNAEAARTQGGGSATVYPARTVSPVDGLRAAFPGASVVVLPGVRPHTRASVARDTLVRRPDGTPGVLVRFLRADGTLAGSEERSGGVLNWMAGLPHSDVAVVEICCTLIADRAGLWDVGASGLGRFELEVGGEPVAGVVLELPPGADVVEGITAPPQVLHRVALDEGGQVDVVVRHRVRAAPLPGEIALGTVLHLNVEPPIGTDDEEIARAVAAAATADVAIVVVGTNEEVESEGYDRHSIALPGRQDALVTAVAAANPRTVVVVNSGAPVLLPWAESVGAVLLSWFPGQEFGTALADVLVGLVEPGGRLPTTWPLDEAHLPSPIPEAGALHYCEGASIGYRDPDRSARYPFGYGLGYTAWVYDAAHVTEQDRGRCAVDVTVRNAGDRAGRTVVQVYLSRPDGAIERPRRWLAAFAHVEAAAGQAVTTRIAIPRRAFEHWDVVAHAWAVEPGAFTAEIGPSSSQRPLVLGV